MEYSWERGTSPHNHHIRGRRTCLFFSLFLSSIWTQMDTLLCVCAHTLTHTHTHTHMCTHALMHTHMHNHAHTHTHTQAQAYYTIIYSTCILRLSMVDWLACGVGMKNSLQVMEGQFTFYKINYIERSVCYVGCLHAICDTVCVNKADRQTEKVKFCQ